MTERVSQRIPYSVLVEFRTASSFLIAYSLNLSRGGLFLETDQEVPVGAAVALEFVVPGIGNTGADGIVTWRRERGSLDGPAGIGIEFQEVSEALGETIDRLVSSFAGLSIVLFTKDRPDRSLSRSIRSILSTAQVLPATDAQLAANLLSDDIDLVVVDIDGDIDGGLATVAAAKAMPSPLPVVALASRSLREAAKAAGADEVVTNPPPFTELQLSLVRALGKPMLVR